MLVGFCFEWSLHDSVAVTMKHNPNILVSTASFDGKATCIIIVKLWNGSLPAVHLISYLSLEGWWGDWLGLKVGWFLCCWLWLVICWAQILPCLCHVTFDCFVRRRGVFWCILIFQARPRGKVASLDGIQPRWFDWEPSSSMEVSYKGFHTGGFISTEGLQVVGLGLNSWIRDNSEFMSNFLSRWGSGNLRPQGKSP